MDLKDDHLRIVGRDSDIFKDHTIGTFIVVVYQAGKHVGLRLDQESTLSLVENIRSMRVTMDAIISAYLYKVEWLRSQLHHQVNEHLKHWNLSLLMGRSFANLDPSRNKERLSASRNGENH